MKTILCGVDMPEKYRKKLNGYADRVTVMPPSMEIEDSTATHPDVLAFYFGGTIYASQGYIAANAGLFASLGCEVIACDVEYGRYPRDVYFNVFAMGGTLFGRTDVVPEAIKRLYADVVFVKQGYAKCSTVTLGSAAITADRGIARAVTGRGFEALAVAPRGVALRGYPAGFIGGAIVSPADGILIPIGDLDTHPDALAIRAFASDHGYAIDNGDSGDPLIDCGGIIVIE